MNFENVVVYVAINYKMCWFIKNADATFKYYVLYYLILQNAAHTVRLDGDIICQQNEVPIWQAAEGPGSLEDIQSVCSCTALTCDPFHIKAKSRLKRSRRDTMETEEDLQGI